MFGVRKTFVDGSEICMAFGHKFAFHVKLQFWYNLEGRAVQVHQSKVDRLEWHVIVPDVREFVHVSGTDAEHRAFSMAVGFITQTA